MSEVKNMIVRCRKSGFFNHARNVESSCNCNFMINEEDIFSILSPGYFEDDERDYYVICPICGYINVIDSKELSDDTKNRINIRSDAEPFLYRKNNLRSEIIYLDRIGKNRVLKKF